MELPFRVLLYRYLFFGWLFRDMGLQRNLFERAAAWRYNQEQSRWLPLYMLRYGVMLPILGGMGWVCERASPLLSTLFYVPATMTVPMLAVAGVGWAMLHPRD